MKTHQTESLFERYIDTTPEQLDFQFVSEKWEKQIKYKKKWIYVCVQKVKPEIESQYIKFGMDKRVGKTENHWGEEIKVNGMGVVKENRHGK